MVLVFGRGEQESVKKRPSLHSVASSWGLWGEVEVLEVGGRGWGKDSVCGQQGFTYQVWTLIGDQLQPDDTQSLWRVWFVDEDRKQELKRP